MCGIEWKHLASMCPMSWNSYWVLALLCMSCALERLWNTKKREGKEKNTSWWAPRTEMILWEGRKKRHGGREGSGKETSEGAHTCVYSPFYHKHQAQDVIWPFTSHFNSLCLSSVLSVQTTNALEQGLPLTQGLPLIQGLLSDHITLVCVCSLRYSC